MVVQATTREVVIQEGTNWVVVQATIKKVVLQEVWHGKNTHNMLSLPHLLSPTTFNGLIRGQSGDDIENTLRSGRTSHERENDAGDAGQDDHPGPSYSFSYTDKESEEDLRSVIQEEDTDEIDED
ncbi:unnamed protein product [Linum trigynum]|uniref:Uncharacterized protein n=1 Tax=Linum trigynum TaxID=586398 RepID=A0AAV2F641_9ROSI